MPKIKEFTVLILCIRTCVYVYIHCVYVYTHCVYVYTSYCLVFIVVNVCLLTCTIILNYKYIYTCSFCMVAKRM